MAKFDSIHGTIGNTPLVKLRKLAPAGVNVYVKLESFNPMSSVKHPCGSGPRRIATVLEGKLQPAIERPESTYQQASRDSQMKGRADENCDLAQRQVIECRGR